MSNGIFDGGDDYDDFDWDNNNGDGNNNYDKLLTLPLKTEELQYHSESSKFIDILDKMYPEENIYKYKTNCTAREQYMGIRSLITGMKLQREAYNKMIN